jgi:hypothetical protein
MTRVQCGTIIESSKSPGCGSRRGAGWTGETITSPRLRSSGSRSSPRLGKRLVPYRSHHKKRERLPAATGFVASRPCACGRLPGVVADDAGPDPNRWTGWLASVSTVFFLFRRQAWWVWALWETAFSAVFQIPVGAFLASTGMAASTPYAAARRSNAAGLIWPSVEWRRRWL